MALHILNRSPFSSRIHEDVRRALAPGDAVLLIEDGVYGVLEPKGWHALPGITLHVLEDDAVARGLGSRIEAPFIVTTVAAFIELTVAHDRSISWF